MSLLDVDSIESVRSELELFTVKPTQTSIEETSYQSFHPITTLDRGNPLEFRLISSDTDYLDLNDSVLYLKARILDENGETISTDLDEGRYPTKAIVFPINNFIGSYFKQVEVYANGKQIGSSNTLYGYRAYLETLLSFDDAAKQEQLEIGGFYKDITSFEDHGATIQTGTSDNKGAVSRFKWVEGSKTFEVLGRIHNELFDQGKLILSKLPITVKLVPSSEKFVLMSHTATNNYQIRLEKAELMVSVKKIASHVRVAHEERLLRGNAKYPIRRIDMKFYTKAANVSDLSVQNLVTGELPKRVVFGLVETESFNGHLHKNPFNFRHFNVSEVILRQNGQPTSFESLKFKFDDKHTTPGYFALLKATNVWGMNRSFGITPSEYAKGFTLYAFNLSSDEDHGANFNLVRDGTLSLDIRLREASTVAITIIAYLEFDSVVEIDSDRNVHYEE